MRTVPSVRDRGAKKDRSAASTAARPECRTAAATGPAGSWAATASSSLSKSTSNAMSAIATDANPASSSAPRARVRVGEVERAAVGHLVVGGERIDQRRALGLLGTGAHRHDRPARGGGHARDLGERAARVGGVEHGVERGDDVEGAVAERHALEVLDDVAGRRAPAARVLDESRGHVQPDDVRAALGGQLGEQARSAAGVEEPRPGEKGSLTCRAP